MRYLISALSLGCLFSVLPLQAQVGPMVSGAKHVSYIQEGSEWTVWVNGAKTSVFPGGLFVPAGQRFVVTEVEYSFEAFHPSVASALMTDLIVNVNGQDSVMWRGPKLVTPKLADGTYSMDRQYFHQNLTVGICIPSGARVTLGGAIWNTSGSRMAIRGYYAPASTSGITAAAGQN